MKFLNVGHLRSTVSLDGTCFNYYKHVLLFQTPVFVLKSQPKQVFVHTSAQRENKVLHSEQDSQIDDNDLSHEAALIIVNLFLN